jgi:hypothetical protein
MSYRADELTVAAWQVHSELCVGRQSPDVVNYASAYVFWVADTWQTMYQLRDQGGRYIVSYGSADRLYIVNHAAADSV